MKIILLFSLLSLFNNANSQAPPVKWARSLNGTGNIYSVSIRYSLTGQYIYNFGYFAGTHDFDPGPGVYNLTASGINDPYLLKLDLNGDIVWVKQLAGTGNTSGLGSSIAEDANGNIFFSGEYNGTLDLDPGAGVLTVTSLFNEPDLFLVKLNSNGDLFWGKTIGGGYVDAGGGIELEESSGNLYISGYFEFATELDPGPGAFNLTSSGVNDAFILKLDSTGNFIWAGKIGGPGDDGVNCHLADNDNLYVSGSIYGNVDVDPTAAIVNLNAGAANKIFFAKMDSSGSVQWAKCMQGTGESFGGIITEDNGNILVYGIFNGTVDADPGVAVYNMQSTGFYDLLLARYDNAGNFIWGKSLGGGYYDYSGGIQYNNLNGTIYISGSFSDSIDIDSGPLQNMLYSSGWNDLFLSALDTSGNYLWSKHFHGALHETGTTMDMDHSGSIVMSGLYRSSVLSIDNYFLQNSDTLAYDVLIVRLDSSVITSTISGLQETSAHVFPNPSSGSFHIRMKKASGRKQLDLVDMKGKLIYSSISENEDVHIANLKFFDTGIYILHIYADDGVYSTKISLIK